MFTKYHLLKEVQDREYSSLTSGSPDSSNTVLTLQGPQVL